LDFLLPLELLAWLAGGALFVLTGYSAVLLALGSGPAPLPPGPPPGPQRVTVLVTALAGSPALGETLGRAATIDHPDLDVLLALGAGGAPTRPAMGLARGVDVLMADGPGGKAHAMNMALQRARGDFVLTLDEDSLVDPDCVAKMLPLAGEGVWAVVGEPYASNAGAGVIQRTLGVEAGAWTRAARARDRLGLFLPATGFFALVRRGSLPGGEVWDEGALAEDTDLSLRQEARGLRVRLSGARVGIEAPSTLGALARQRLRWYKGVFDALWKNRGAVTRLGAPKAIDAVLSLLSPVAPAAFLVLLLLSPLWPLTLGPVLGGVLAVYLLSAWASSSGVGEGRLGVVLFSVPYAVVQGGVALAAIVAFLLRIRVGWQRTPKSAEVGRAKERRPRPSDATRGSGSASPP
jgi:cellulose synthase/poly-beta-1,6-N-acetylglucosamine synthase-like glycosyltransferase